MIETGSTRPMKGSTRIKPLDDCPQAHPSLFALSLSTLLKTGPSTTSPKPPISARSP
jgi:hypothetical protein